MKKNIVNYVHGRMKQIFYIYVRLQLKQTVMYIYFFYNSFMVKKCCSKRYRNYVSFRYFKEHFVLQNVIVDSSIHNFYRLKSKNIIYIYIIFCNGFIGRRSDFGTSSRKCFFPPVPLGKRMV